MKKIRIGKYQVENFSPPFIIAEIGANHNGSMNLAIKLIDKACECGCHSVKFQSWSKESLFSNIVYKNNKKLENDIDSNSLQLSDLAKLKKYCDKKGIIFSTSVFSKKEVDFFAELKIEYLKIASMDINNYGFLEYVAKKSLPTILSTGLADMEEIHRAVGCITKYNKKLILLHCVSLYPPRDDQIHLNNIDLLRENFNYPVGFSDHSQGITIALASIVKGVSVIEKHFTLDKHMAGWDHAISLESKEMHILVRESMRVPNALGNVIRILGRDDLKKRVGFRRSLVSSRFLKRGDRIKEEDLEFKRPGYGLPPETMGRVVGRKIKRNIPKDEIIKVNDFE